MSQVPVPRLSSSQTARRFVTCGTAWSPGPPAIKVGVGTGVPVGVPQAGQGGMPADLAPGEHCAPFASRPKATRTLLVFGGNVWQNWFPTIVCPGVKVLVPVKVAIVWNWPPGAFACRLAVQPSVIGHEALFLIVAVHCTLPFDPQVIVTADTAKL